MPRRGVVYEQLHARALRRAAELSATCAGNGSTGNGSTIRTFTENRSAKTTFTDGILKGKRGNEAS